MRAAFGAVATLSAAATLWAGGVFGSGPTTSRPIFVSASCHAPPNAAACAVALRYLAALDLDRGREACGLLDDPTLQAAGGTDGCSRTLAQARGIRIQYRVAAVNRSPLGWT